MQFPKERFLGEFDQMCSEFRDLARKNSLVELSALAKDVSLYASALVLKATRERKLSSDGRRLLALCESIASETRALIQRIEIQRDAASENIFHVHETMPMRAYGLRELIAAEEESTERRRRQIDLLLGFLDIEEDDQES